MFSRSGSFPNTPTSSAQFKSPRVRQERQTNFKVVIRVRPPLPRELNGDPPFRNVIAVDDREQMITVSENIDSVMHNLSMGENGGSNNAPIATTYSFTFDYVYDQNCTQKKVYETTARPVVDSALLGYNATIFAYGQTGAGKTFTMEGFHHPGRATSYNNNNNIENRGIIPRAIEQIFNHIQSYASSHRRFLVRASYLQIYNEMISDLLKPERNNLSIREDKKKGVYVDGLSEWVVRSPAEIYGLMERGGSVRATGETKMNELSSRSHAVFIVIVEQSETVYIDNNGDEMNPEEFQKFIHTHGIKREHEMQKLEDHVRQTFKVGKLNLVDLAGSERVQRSGATGQRLEESKQINRSLSMLGYVISALTEAKDRQHIPYRNSKLTRMLEDSLGGNCKTTMMAMVSPAFEAMMETISTLKFANRAKNIRNEAKVNEDLDQKSLLRKYERELKKLRAELEEKSKNVVDKRRLLELDEQRRRAEADKMAAIRALEARSLEFMQEKEEKKRLEQRIAMLMNQMIRGERGNIASPTGEPLIDENMKEQQEKLRQEYESKLSSLERERESIEEEKAQVDRYKQLLLKQRDIMIALTQRLVERDEQIMALQDELDAYDRHHKELEEKLDEKTALLIKFQRISMEVNATSPHKSEELNKALESWPRSEQSLSQGPTEVAIPIDDDQSNLNSPNIFSASSNKQHYQSDSPEKIQHLNSVIDFQKNTIKSLENQIESFKSGSSSLSLSDSSQIQSVFEQEMEKYLSTLPEHVRIGLREPLLSVSNQASRRLASSSSSLNGNNEEIQSLREENQLLKSKLESNEIKIRCDNLIKEREAVQTIMEHKIKILVQSVAQAANSMISSNMNITNTPAANALTKDLTALQRLVNASIAALKNAANSSSASTTSTSSVSTSSSQSITPPSPRNSIDSSLPPPPPPLGSSLISPSASFSRPPNRGVTFSNEVQSSDGYNTTIRPINSSYK